MSTLTYKSINLKLFWLATMNTRILPRKLTRNYSKWTTSRVFYSSVVFAWHTHLNTILTCQMHCLLWLRFSGDIYDCKFNFLHFSDMIRDVIDIAEFYMTALRQTVLSLLLLKGNSKEEKTRWNIGLLELQESRFNTKILNPQCQWHRGSHNQKLFSLWVKGPDGF